MGRKSNADQRRSEIVWALYDCLAEQGHEKVTIKVIAARAGLPYGVIHYYFDRKEDIVSSLAQVLVDHYSQMLNDRLAEAPTGHEAVATAIDFVVDQLIFDRRLNRVFFNLTQMAFEREPLHQVMTAMFRVYRQRLADVLAAVGPPPQDPAVGAAVVALAEGFALQWMIEPGVFSKKEVKAALMRAVGAGT
jgi:AcrR family transcriptional regulator